MLSLKNISKSALPKIGDTVLTSPYSSSFPAQLMIGKVTSIVQDPSSNFLTLNIKSATNFYNLEFVYLVENKRMGAQSDIEQKGDNNE
jgi:rod shape-determining protein MreC